jgi:uncharacterized protein (TIGR01244 family)
MTQFRHVNDQLSVSPQIAPADLADAAQQGFRHVINNRPDGEEPGQPTSAEMEAAALAAGLTYAHIPVRGGPTREQAEAMHQLMEAAQGPTLAFCRSGTRSIVTYSLGELAFGGADRAELVEAGAKAGYDLGGMLPR